jgi:hypothetical protein
MVFYRNKIISWFKVEFVIKHLVLSTLSGRLLCPLVSVNSVKMVLVPFSAVISGIFVVCPYYVTLLKI